MQHRPGRFSQRNKPYKLHSKSSLEKKGRVHTATRSSIKSKAVAQKASRHQSLAARRKQIREDAMQKRRIGSRHGPPKIVALVALSPAINVKELKQSILSGLKIRDTGAIVQTVVITHPQRSRLTLLCVRRDTRSVLDAAKVADIVLFALNPTELLDDHGKLCLQLLRAQGLPSHILLSMQTRRLKKREKTRFGQFCRQEFPTDPRVVRWTVPSAAPVALFRSLVETTADPLNWREARPYLLVEQCRFTPTGGPPPGPPPPGRQQQQQQMPRPNITPMTTEFQRRMAELGVVPPPPPSVVAAAAAAAAPPLVGPAPGQITGTLELRGYLRGRRLSPNQLIHITNYGSYRPVQVATVPDPHPLVGVRRRRPATATTTTTDDDDDDDVGLIDMDVNDDGGILVVEEEDVDMLASASSAVSRPPRLTTLFPTPGGQETLQESADLDLLPGGGGRGATQVSFPHQEGENEGEGGDTDGDALMDTTASGEATFPSAIPPPVSFDREMNIVDDGDDSGLGPADVGDVPDEVRNEESRSFRRMLRRHRLDQKADDYVDVPEDQSAKDRFAKYKALQSFRKSDWDPAADLPMDYSRIFQFRDFGHSKKLALELTESEENSIDCETFVSVVLGNVPQRIMQVFNPAMEIMVLFGLLRHENKISVVNFSIRKVKTFTEPITNKEPLMVQIGFRRYSCRPVLSDHNLRSDKFKMLRVMPDHLFSVGTIYAHVTYPPAPVLVFKRTATGATVLAASGSLLSVDPSRIILRKIVLTGHISRAHKRRAIVRFMFTSPEDVSWFQPVELVTTTGKRGVIRQSVGTHGYMKCLFQDFVQQNELALMNLYKRVFPKWDHKFVSYLEK